MKYLVLAYYAFIKIENPQSELQKHRKFFKDRDVSGRIYFSEEGINGQMSGSKGDAEAYMEWLRQDPRFSQISFKIHEHFENIFPRMTLKVRKQLVALDVPVDMGQTGEHISPACWRQKMEEDDPDLLILDVRNSYESEIGTFDKAICPPLETFRDFPKYADQLREERDPKKTKVMMCCTGGIRCELYSALLKEKGFETVYQLDGGIINYGLKEGQKHWKGKLFVFDDRMAVSIDGKETEVISNCSHCKEASDTYYNCANMDCNNLFLACPSCIDYYQGCCCLDCKDAPRRRPYKREGGNKPFRRKHFIDHEESESK